jgi:hypothetical protein
MSQAQSRDMTRPERQIRGSSGGISERERKRCSPDQQDRARLLATDESIERCGQRFEQGASDTNVWLRQPDLDDLPVALGH